MTWCIQPLADMVYLMLSFALHIVYGLCFRQCYAYRIWSVVCFLMAGCQTAFNHDQCCVCWWHGTNVISAIGKYRIEVVFYIALCYARMIFASVCATCIGYDQYCVCRRSGVKLHPIIGRWSIKFVFVCWTSAMCVVCDLCFRQHYVHSVCLGLCMLMAWCRTTFNHWQMQHRVCTCLLNFCHGVFYEQCFHMLYVYSVWSVLCVLMACCQSTFNHLQTAYALYSMLSFAMHIVCGLCFRLLVKYILEMLCLLMVWGQNAFQHWQARHSICVSCSALLCT